MFLAHSAREGRKGLSGDSRELPLDVGAERRRVLALCYWNLRRYNQPGSLKGVQRRPLFTYQGKKTVCGVVVLYIISDAAIFSLLSGARETIHTVHLK